MVKYQQVSDALAKMENISQSLTKLYRDKRILILGGMGFIGSNMAHRLVDMGAQVTILDAMLPLYGGNKANIRGIENRVEVVIGDIRDFELLQSHVKRNDFVFHFASQTSHVDSMKDPYTDIDINCRGTINVLEAAKRSNPKARIVEAGTRSQIGRQLHEPADENHAEFPMDIYSANKTAAEKYFLIYAWTHQLFTTCVRLTNLYGPRAQVKNPGYGVVNYFVRLAIQNQTIQVYEPGLQKRDLLFVDDAVQAMLLVATSEKAKGQVFNVASGAQVSLIDIVKKIVEAAGTGSYKTIPWPNDRKSIEVGDVSLSIDKIGNLGWRPSVGLEAGLRTTVRYFEAHLQDYI